MVGDLELRYDESTAADYKIFDERPQKIDARLSELLDGIPLRGERVLDYGCGRGYMFKELLSRGAVSISGCDPSSAMIGGARALLEGGRCGDDPPVALDLLSSTVLPYEDSSFGFVLSRFVFHYIPDTGPALREIARVLRPGGVLLAVFSDVRFASGSESLANSPLPLIFGGIVPAMTLAKPGSEVAASARAAGLSVTLYESVECATEAVIDPSYTHLNDVELRTGLLVAHKTL